MDEMPDTKKELVEEVKELRERLRQLEKREAQHRKAHREMLYTAKHDRSTGLFSQIEFMEQLGLAVRASKRYRYPLSLCLCVLSSGDGEDGGNGAAIGEKLRERFGRIIHEQIRCSDAAARYDGKAFSIIFTHTTASDATTATGRIRRALEDMARVQGNGDNGHVTSSSGIAQLAESHEDENDFLRSARQALQKAAEKGGSSLVVQGG